MRESCPLKDLIDWQKVIKIHSSELRKQIYETSGLEKQAELFTQHSKFLHQSKDLDAMYSMLMAKIDTKKTEDNSEEF